MIGINHKIYLVLVFLVSGIIIIWFLPSFIMLGYMGYDLMSGWVNGSDHLLAPPQDVYRKDPEIMAALRFLSRQWNTSVDDLYVFDVLAAHEVDSSAFSKMKNVSGIWVAEVGGKVVDSSRGLDVVESSSFKSAHLFIASAGYPNTNELSNDSIAHENNIYLVNEFEPKSAQQMSIARKFYTTPSPLKEGEFAVISQLNVTPLGNGEIIGLGGNPRFPVIFGFVFKRSMYEIDVVGN